MQAEDRGGGQIDIRRTAVVEGYAEHLADLTGCDWQALGCVEPRLAARRPAGRADIDDTADDAIKVDYGAAGLRNCA